MKNILAILALTAVGLAQAATIEFNFDDNDGVVDVNTFGAGVTVGEFTITHDPTGSHDFNGSSREPSAADGMARGGARKSAIGGLFMSFTVTIPAGVTADLTGLTWENGLDFNGADMTPLWSIAIDNGGTATPASGSMALFTDAGYFGTNVATTLSGLTGLTDTTVTFTFDHTQEDRQNSVVNIANCMDDVVLTGTASGTPTLPPTIDSFSVNDDNVFTGTEITLSWTTSEADTLTLNPGFGDVTGLTSTQAVITADTTFELIADNAHGSVTSTVPVTVITTPPTINSFTASSTNIYGPTEITLTWDTTDATGLSLDQGIGDVTGITSTQILVSASSTYTLTATNVNGSTTESVIIALFNNPTLFSSGFDGHTGVPVLAGNTDNTTGSASAGITDWSTDSSVTAISDLTVISPGAGFSQLQGGTASLANSNNLFIASNLNSDRPAYRGYSLTFTTDAPNDLHSLLVTAGHANNAGATQAYVSDLTMVLSGGTLGTPITNTLAEVSYVDADWVVSEFDLAGTTLGAGSYSLDVKVNNMVGGGAYAVFDGISLIAEAAATAATLSSGVISGGSALEVSWFGEPGTTYTLQTNINLMSGEWGDLEPGLIGAAATISTTNSTGADTVFYRVISE